MELSVNIAAYLDTDIRLRPWKFLSGSHTVTGAVTLTTLPSSIRSSLALWQISRTWASGMGLQARSCAIALEMAVSLHRLCDAATLTGRDRSFFLDHGVGLPLLRQRRFARRIE
jgi:hypothetical protein